jgi:hypothetical protein
MLTESGIGIPMIISHFGFLVVGILIVITVFGYSAGIDDSATLRVTAVTTVRANFIFLRAKITTATFGRRHVGSLVGFGDA